MSKRNKTVETNESVSDFLDSVEDIRKRSDSTELVAMMSEISGCDPKMWGTSIVGFGTYHYKYASGREGDLMKIGFSPRKQSLTLYIIPGFDRYDAILNELGKYKTGKSCLYIKNLDDVDRVKLRDLVKSCWDYMTVKYG